MRRLGTVVELSHPDSGCIDDVGERGEGHAEINRQSRGPQREPDVQPPMDATQIPRDPSDLNASRTGISPAPNLAGHSMAVTSNGVSTLIRSLWPIVTLDKLDTFAPNVVSPRKSRWQKDPDGVLRPSLELFSPQLFFREGQH